MSDSIQDASPISTQVLLLEHWKPIHGFEGYYEISNVGEICRIKAYKNTRYGKRCRKSVCKKTGYCKVTLSKDNKLFYFNVHHLVASVFIRPPILGETVNHENGWKLKNWVSNFTFMSRGDNVRHAYAMGLGPRGERSYNAKLTDDDIREMRSSQGVLGYHVYREKFAIAESTYYRILARTAWRHVK